MFSHLHLYSAITRAVLQHGVMGPIIWTSQLQRSLCPELPTIAWYLLCVCSMKSLRVCTMSLCAMRQHHFTEMDLWPREPV